VFGWPAVGASLAAFAIGILTGRVWSATTGAVLAAPFCLFVSGYPGISYWGLVALVANAGSVLALRGRRTVVAIVALTPFVAIAIRLAFAVLSQ